MERGGVEWARIIIVIGWRIVFVWCSICICDKHEWLTDNRFLSSLNFSVLGIPQTRLMSSRIECSYYKGKYILFIISANIFWTVKKFLFSSAQLKPIWKWKGHNHIGNWYFFCNPHSISTFDEASFVKRICFLQFCHNRFAQLDRCRMNCRGAICVSVGITKLCSFVIIYVHSWNVCRHHYRPSIECTHFLFDSRIEKSCVCTILSYVCALLPISHTLQEIRSIANLWKIEEEPNEKFKWDGANRALCKCWRLHFFESYLTVAHGVCLFNIALITRLQTEVHTHTHTNRM